MKVKGIQTTNINGEDYWLVNQFAKLTQRTEGSIRVLINKGNRIRKLKCIKFGGKPFIESEELFDFPFVICGQPSKIGTFVEQFYMESGQLLREEKVYKPCQ